MLIYKRRKREKEKKTTVLKGTRNEKNSERWEGKIGILKFENNYSQWNWIRFAA